VKTFILTLLVLLAAAPALAFEYMEQCEDEPGGVAWRFEDGPITWHLSSTYPSSDLTETEVRSTVLGAFSEWNAPACANVPSQQGVAVAEDPMDVGPEELIIGFYEAAWPAALGEGLLALTRIEFNAAECEMVGGDITFNGDDWTWVIGVPTPDGTQADLQAVMTHEVGHLLGLDHTGIGGSSMNFPYDYDLAWRTLGCDDTGGICDLYPSGDASCADSAYCPCNHPCVDGFCDGLTFSDDVGECWTLFLPEETYAETEPNNESDAVEPIQLSGGDFVINGSSLDCGNDGAQPIADRDWFNFDAPCSGRVFVTLEPQAGDADVDLFVYDDTVGAADAQTRDTGSLEALEAEVGKDFQILVYCWEGSATNWVLRVKYLAPGEIAELPGDEPQGCDCSVGRGLPVGGPLLLMLLLGLSRRGGCGRAVPSSPCGGPSRRDRCAS
jgi:hypothetical protein